MQDKKTGRVLSKSNGRADAPREFIVMDSQLRYFCGFQRGGAFLWLDDHARAKRLDDVRKFETLRRLCPGELAMGWCDEGPARRPARKRTRKAS
jgi:hypothetical protein